MNHKERVLAAIHLEEPDRVPISPSGFHELCLKRLFNYFNVKEAMALHAKLDLDAVIVSAGDGMITYAEGSIPKRLSDGSLINEWGVRYIVPPDRDHIFVDHPIKHPDDFDDYVFPDPTAPARLDLLKKTVEKYGDDYAIVGSIDYGIFEKAWLLRGFTSFITDLYTHPSFVEKLLDRLTNFDAKLIDQMCGHNIDILFVSDDLGTQNSLIISPKIFRRFFKQRWDKLLRIPKNIPVMFHSDGNIEKLIPDLIEIGVDILNPVQPKAMDPAAIKAKYGDKLAQYGTVDIQETLPFGTVHDVKREVITRMKTVGYDGGLVLAPSHTILPDVPLKNYLAFVEAAKKYGKYPIKR